MNPHDPNFWPVFFILGVPIILLGGGPYGWRALIVLAFLAGLASHPLIAIPLAILWCFRWLVADFFLAFVAGLGGGLGLRASGFRRDRDAPRRSLRDRRRG